MIDTPVVNWACTNCGSGMRESNLAATLIPAVRMGKCWGCGKRGTFRPAAGAVTVATEPKRKGPSKAPGLLEAGPVDPNPAAGAREKEVGMRGAEFAETPSGWVARADAAIARQAATGKPFTSDVIVAEVGMPAHYNAVGARMNAAARRGIIRKVGHTQAARPSAHARTVAVWQGDG